MAPLCSRAHHSVSFTCVTTGFVMLRSAVSAGTDLLLRIKKHLYEQKNKNDHLTQLHFTLYRSIESAQSGESEK